MQIRKTSVYNHALRLAFILAVLTIPARAADTTLVPTGGVWKYLDNGSNQGTAWCATGFDDSVWPSGAAQLGYGDGDEVTTPPQSENIMTATSTLLACGGLFVLSFVTIGAF